MKKRYYSSLVPFWIVLFAFFSVAKAQEKTKKQLKEERKLEKQKQIAQFVELKEFVFVVNKIIPQSGITINPASPYRLEFYPEWINSYLPFFGRGFSRIGYGGDAGLLFEGKPSIYTVKKTKKGYQIIAEVQANNDTFSIMFTVFFEGNAYLTINSNNRSSISYDGEIEAFKSKK